MNTLKQWKKIFRRNHSLDQITPKNMASTIEQMTSGTYSTITITFRDQVLRHASNPNHHEFFVKNLNRVLHNCFRNSKGKIIDKYKGLTICLFPEISKNGRLHYHGIITHKNITYGSFVGMLSNKLKTLGNIYGEIHTMKEPNSNARVIESQYGQFKTRLTSKLRNVYDVRKYILKDQPVMYPDYKAIKMSI